jgi:cytoskeletal protein CcmA (bactofilin family)
MESHLEEFEFDINLFAENSVFKGELEFGKLTRLNGEVYGTILARPGAPLILGENAYVKANIEAETLVVDGFLEGDIKASGLCRLNPTATVLGNIHAGQLQIQPGATFNGKCFSYEEKPFEDKTKNKLPLKNEIREDPLPAES